MNRLSRRFEARRVINTFSAIYTSNQTYLVKPLIANNSCKRNGHVGVCPLPITEPIRTRGLILSGAWMSFGFIDNGRLKPFQILFKTHIKALKMSHKHRKPTQLVIKTRFSYLPSPDQSPKKPIETIKTPSVKSTSPILNPDVYSMPEVPVRSKTVVNKDHIRRLAYSDPDYIQKDLREAEKATVMVLESRYTAAEAFLKTRHGRSLYFTYGLACLTFQKAVMSFDPVAISECLSALEDSIRVASILRKSTGGLFASLIPTKSTRHPSDFKSMDVVERHAELVFASSTFFRSLLTISTNLTVLTIVTEGFKLRSCFFIFKSCYKYIHTIFMEEGQEGFKRHGIDEHFVAGVLMGMGGFNLAFSMAPPNMVKVCESIGFSADRQFAMSCLETGARWPKRDFSMIYPSDKGRKPSAIVDFDMPPSSNGTTNIQSLFCDWVLFGHHTVLSTLLPIPEADFPFAKTQLEHRLGQFPKSILYLILQARLNDTMGQMTLAESQIIALIQMQKDWQTLVHGGIWALGFIKAAQGKWREAAGCFEVLSRESKWSPAVYGYLKAVCLYHEDKDRFADTIFLTMRMVPGLVQRLAAGQCLPDEKFVARKARKFLAQGGRLTLPGYEAIYMLWTGFDCFHHERMPSIVSEIDAELAHLQSQSTTSTDDTCLAHFLRGLALKQFATPFNKTLIPAIDLIHLKPSLVKQSHLKKALKEFGTVVSLSGRLDTDLYLLPFARFECALVYQRLGEYDKAMYEAKAAGRGGALSNEKRSVTGKKKAFSMDLLLGLKVHNLKLKLEILDRLSGWKGEKSDEIWAAYSTTSQ